MDRLGELRTLVAIVDTGSLAAAARRLRRSPPSVTRDLADLERRVGASLFERSTRTCRATPAGLRLAEQARQLLDNYEEALGEAAGEATTPRGLVRITAPTTFGRDHVAPLVNGFLDAHSEITVDLQLIDRVVDLAEEEFDLAVRIGRLPNSALVVRSVGELRQLVVASPAYLRSREPPEHPRDLADHELIQHAGRSPNAPWVFRDEDGGTVSIPVRARLAVNQSDAAIAAALTGRGIVRALTHQVGPDLRAGRLVRLLDVFEPEPLPISLVWLPSRRSWRRMRLLIDHLTVGLGKIDILRCAN